MTPAVLELAADTLIQLRARQWRVATAESCTGGLIGAYLTAIAGSSDMVDRGFITYSNAAKTEMLGVPAALIAAHGAVSLPVASAMAAGALKHSNAAIAVSVTGVAGPGGGTPEKPVGLVCFGLAATREPVRTAQMVFPGDRAAVREATVTYALKLLRDAAAGG